MKNRTVLIADDDRSVRKALRMRLSSWGYQVVESVDGLGVITQASSRTVAALILDYGMPNGDGQAVARMIRGETEAPIIFLSGHDREDFRSIVHDLPDVYYLHKPLDPEKLRLLLEACLTISSSPVMAEVA